MHLLHKVRRYRAATLLLMVLAGCNSQAPAPTPVALKIATDEGPLTIVKRAEYENWSQFPVGTVVTRSRELTKGDEKVQQVTAYKLISKDDKNVIVESTVTLNRNGQVQVNEPSSLEYAATFRLPTNMTAEQFSLPSPSAKASGTEVIEVLGKSYEATVYKWQSSAEAGPVDNTLWMSDQVPGRSIKHQSKCAGTVTEETITQIDMPQTNG